MRTLAKAHVAAIADDDVVEDVHAEQLAGINESSREGHVVRAWRRVTITFEAALGSVR